MDSQKVTTRATQESVMKMLSDDEVSKVSTAEAGAPLTENEPYLDLENLDRGVQQARGAMTAMGRVLPKSAVHPDTWTKILAHLAAPQAGMEQADGAQPAAMHAADAHARK